MSLMFLPASLDGQHLSLLAGSLTAQQAKSVQLGELLIITQLARQQGC